MKRLLVVDDVEVNRRVLSLLLQQLGCACDVACDAESALAAFRSAHFDAVMTDYRMPGADGVSLARALRAEPSAKGCRMALLTGDGDIPPVDGSLFDTVMVKPVSRDSLEAFLAQVAENGEGL